MFRSKRTLAGLVVAAALIAGACGSDGGETTSAPASAASDGASGPLAQVATAVDGSSVDLAQFDGTDTIAWFWAPW